MIQADVGHIYKCGKTYTHNIGLSCAFRQWQTESHCHFLHGYALQVELEFEAKQLNDENWVQGFGDLKPVKAWLEDMFDHKTLVAEDDPKLKLFTLMFVEGMIDMKVVPTTGCEAFARIVYEGVKQLGFNNLQWVTIREHAGNWASYGKDLLQSGTA